MFIKGGFTTFAILTVAVGIYTVLSSTCTYIKYSCGVRKRGGYYTNARKDITEKYSVVSQYDFKHFC